MKSKSDYFYNLVIAGWSYFILCCIAGFYLFIETNFIALGIGAIIQSLIIFLIFKGMQIIYDRIDYIGTKLIRSDANSPADIKRQSFFLR